MVNLPSTKDKFAIALSKEPSAGEQFKFHKHTRFLVSNILQRRVIRLYIVVKQKVTKCTNAFPLVLRKTIAIQRLMNVKYNFYF